MAEIAKQIPSLERIVVVPYLSQSPELARLERDDIATPMTWGQLGRAGRGAKLDFERVPSTTPWVLYSSGTTGLRRRSCRVTAGSCSSS